ncbi:hypothetical protein O1611_g107 [Lasiodiplodia mahajangana]|uniref:Uncharacterized protein n=1 Tax=Lasiodiplodia mahajangana TaxID=1108764 RepID=A0ACC2K1M9_9PEZI|nr:hypothetical protein O1611_g107 [Lasiodiplodia mahajangana]
MFQHFHPRHIPALIAGTTMAFGGIWPMFDPYGAMRDFGFPDRIAKAPEAAPVMVTGNVRTTVLGALMLLYYSRRQYEILDTFMAFTGAYAGIVDSYVVWREGRPRQAVFRLISSGLIAAWGFLGWTAGK